MIGVTGATGKLGRHVIEGLLQRMPADQVVAAVRSPEKAADLRARGVQVRRADYDSPETLVQACAGVTKLLLISSTDLVHRQRQHRAVIDAAQQAHVGLLAYTSILHADTARHMLAADHRATEAYLRQSKLPFVLLRNGWYMENYTENLDAAVQHGKMMGSSGEGRVAAATRAEYAAAAVEVLTGEGHENKIYELAGDNPFTMAQLAAEVARRVGKPVAYMNMPSEQYRGVLEGFGMPGPVAAMLADADVGIGRGELNDQSGDLQRLMRSGTLPLSRVVAAAMPRA